jgi:hypothetical protein
MKLKLRQLLLMAAALVAIGFVLVHEDSPVQLQPRIRKPDNIKRSNHPGLNGLKKRVSSWISNGSSASNPNVNLSNWLQQQAQNIGKTDHQPDRTKEELTAKALELSTEDFQTLKKTAFDTRLQSDRRFLAVYVLALSEAPEALHVLRDIGREPIPPTANDRSYSDEVIIRTQALEALTKRLPTEERKRFLTELIAQTSDPLMARQAKYWLSKGS